MSVADWYPLGVENQAGQFAVLQDGVPPWMAESFWEWVNDRFVFSQPGGARSFDGQLLRLAERRLQFSTGLETLSGGSAVLARLRSVVLRADIELRLADFLLAHPRVGSSASITVHTGVVATPKPSLDEILRQSGSAWKVGQRLGKPGLERRVPQGVEDAATDAIANSGEAGQLLATAWGHAFGLDPNPSQAYGDAVRAVKAATIAVVLPGQRDKTLGNVIRQLQGEYWALPLEREHPQAQTRETLIAMCRTLWRGHRDRHAGQPEGFERVTAEEAEAAVVMAVPLVQWFTSGAVVRREPPTPA